MSFHAVAALSWAAARCFVSHIFRLFSQGFAMSRLAWFLVVALSVSLVGCEGKTASGGAPVSGVVTFDGQPMSGAIVTFVPMGATTGNGGVGVSDDSGKFTMKTHDGGEGIPEGEYKVVVSKFVNPDGSTFVATENQAPIDSGATESVPRPYSDWEVTPLKAVIPAAGTEVKFDLKSKP
jgi:hypothetical protein